MSSVISLVDNPRILARELHFGDAVMKNMLIECVGDRVEVSPFQRETANTVYIDRPVSLSPCINPLPLQKASLHIVG